MIEVRANGITLDVKKGERIKYVKQVADLADLSSSNASTTTSFKLPKSPTNKQMMQMLGIAGDGSQIPYQRVVAQLLDKGIPIIKNGWFQVKNTDDNYNASVQDGIIDFFKAIEGKKLGTDVDLSELNHVKDVPTVIASMTNEIYTYLVNDYGGQTVLLNEFLTPFNIDYLVPSARIKYLHDKVFQSIGFTYSGTIFESEDFQNAWLTFPKTNSELISTNVANFAVEEIQRFPTDGFSQTEYGLEFRTFFPMLFTESEIVLPNYMQVAVEPNRIQSIFITQTDSYQFKINFDATAEYRLRAYANPNYTGIVNAPLKIKVFKNNNPIEGAFIIGGSDELTVPISAVQGDIISFRIYALTFQELNVWIESQDSTPFPENDFFFSNMEGIEWGNLTLSIDQVTYAETEFNDTFKDFDIKSFIKEIMWRFALTAIPDNENNHVTFYTIDELLDESRGVIDISDKYIRRKDERYTLGSYAQKNWLRHKYNTEDSNYDDGLIQVNNQNLNDETTLLTSKTYAPEENSIILPYAFGQSLTVNPTLIWSTEVKENSDGEPEISYKGLTGRYYWLKKRDNEFSALFNSVQLGQSEQADLFNIATSLDTTFSDLVPKYHQGHIRLLNDIRVHEIEVNFSIVDIINFDLSKLYYIKQEASYYKPNKLTFEENKPAILELIRVKRG